jgi:hypothetical protein
MPDYQKGKIYRIFSPSKNLVYYGSTVQTLNQRLAGHVRDYKKYNDTNISPCQSYLVLECDDYKMELIEEYPCNNKQQLFKKEGEYIKTNDCVNKIITGRTPKEYRQDNKEKISQNAKEYRKDNIENLKNYDKEYYIQNADKRKEYTKNWLKQNKDYIEQNKQKKKEYDKEYRLKKKQEQVNI